MIPNPGLVTWESQNLPLEKEFARTPISVLIALGKSMGALTTFFDFFSHVIPDYGKNAYMSKEQLLLLQGKQQY